MDSDSDNSDTDVKPKIEDVLVLNEIYKSNQKEKKHYYGKKKYKNAKIVASVEVTDEILEKMIVDDLNGHYFPGYVKYFKSNYKECLDQSMKNSQKSIEARIKANDLLVKKPHTAQIHKDIWELYSKSVAFAPAGSKELVLAYEARSNLLLHLKKYEDCVKDIERAMAITSFDLLKVKLLCRKMNCLVAMDKNTVEKIEVWDALNHHFGNIDVAFKDEKFLTIVETAKTQSQKQPSTTKGPGEDTDRLSPPIIHENNIEVVCNRQLCIVAKRDFVPGDLIVYTKPLVTSFNPNKFYAYCSHCLSFMWAGVPCDECSLCMYCSEKCKTEAWDQYHILECKILPHINFENINYNKMHLSTRVLLRAIRKVGSISKLREVMQDVDKLKDAAKLDESYQKSDFLRFYIVSHTHINSSPYNLDFLSKMAMKACFLTYCMIQTCDFFEKKNFKSFRGKELAKEQDIINFGFVILKIMISITSNLKAAGSYYKNIDLCDKYAKTAECNTNRHCIRGTYYDIYHAMFEKSCNPNVARCWTHDGKIIYYCLQPIKKMEKITICHVYEFFKFDKAARDKYTYFSKYCQCTACLKDWPVMEKLYEKSKQRRWKVESRHTEIVQKYLERNQSTTNIVQDKNCTFNTEEYKQLLRDVNDVVKACGQPSFASSMMIYYLCIAFEKRYGTVSLLSNVPAKC